MTVGAILERPRKLHHPEGIDWVRRDKEPMPSPTHSQSTDSATSPYNMPQSVPVLYHPYPPAAPSRQTRYTHQPHDDSSGEYDVFQTPTQPHRGGSEYPRPVVFDQTQIPTLTTSRSYDTTIPQYYPIMAERQWTQTSDKGGKRKREKGKEVGTAAPVRTVKTPKRSKVGSEERSTKRAKTESQSSQSQLPTPPSTGRDLMTISLPPHLLPVTQPAEPQILEETEPRRGLKVTQSEEEGRKLAVGQVLEEEESSPVGRRSSRLASAPTIVTSESGIAALTTQSILESELAWLENAGRPPSPSTPERTPARSVEPPVIFADDSDDADVKAEKIDKRLKAFSITSRAEPMMCTTLEAFGRVAVRKDAAVKFLGLETGEALTEETKEDDEWVESSSVASSSRVRIKPNWPDEQTPWSSGGGRVKKLREEKEREVLLKRYMEHSGDEESEEEFAYSTFQGKGKGKSVSHLIRVPDHADPRRQIRTHVNVNADAKTALLTSLRYRNLPPQPAGVVACACGQSANGMSSLVVCVNCQTWHHTICNNIDDRNMPNRWWCPNCENQVMNLSTPAQTPRRAYAQSEERSSAFKGHADNIALAPSPIFMSTSQYSQAGPSVQTPVNRSGAASPTSRNHRSRILSYGTDMWAPYGEEPGMLPTPSTPVPSDHRFTTPRIDDAPFDVTSTPSRHIDFNFGGPGGPSLFSLTPLGGRSRVPTNMMTDTPLTYRQRLTSQSEPHGLMGGRHDFLRDLAGPSGLGPPSPSAARRNPALLGASSIAAVGMGHRRTLSGNKMSSMRHSSRSGLGLGMPIGADTVEEGDADENDKVS